MARKSSSAISDDEFEGAVSEPARRSRLADESPLDARLMDLEDDAESPFLRGQKRVRVKRGPLPLPRSTTGRLKLGFVIVAALAVIAILVGGVQHYATQSWRFRLESSDKISVSGLNNVSRAQVMDVMGSDIDRNVFFVPLEQRKQQLEQIPWIRSASVMRLLPEPSERRHRRADTGSFPSARFADQADRCERRHAWTCRRDRRRSIRSP